MERTASSDKQGFGLPTDNEQLASVSTEIRYGDVSMGGRFLITVCFYVKEVLHFNVSFQKWGMVETPFWTLLKGGAPVRSRGSGRVRWGSPGRYCAMSDSKSGVPRTRCPLPVWLSGP